MIDWVKSNSTIGKVGARGRTGLPAYRFTQFVFTTTKLAKADFHIHTVIVEGVATATAVAMTLATG